MKKVLILDTIHMIGPIRDRFEFIAEMEGIPVKVDKITSLFGEPIPTGYDIYSLHSSLVRPLSLIEILRADNPSAYIILRETIGKASKKTLDSINKYCISYNEQEGDIVGEALAFSIPRGGK